MNEGIDISRKYKEACLAREDTTIEIGLVDKLPEYGYITYKSRNKIHIGPITYEYRRIGNITQSNLQEVTIYYHIEYDNNPEKIEKPLILRVSNGGAHYLYFNTGGNNTKWNDVPVSELSGIPSGNTTTPKFTEMLNDITCKLYDLHSVDIYQNGYVNGTYSCPCKKINVEVESYPNKDGIDGYIGYLHKYKDSITRVRYKGTILTWKGEGVENEEIPLSEIIKNLSVYYWDEDKNRRKRPLLMEVYVGEMPVLVGNNGESDNSKWNMIVGDDGWPKILSLGESVSEETLHEQKCKVFHPVVMDVSQIGPYENPYCKDISHSDCPKDIKVTNYTEVTLDNYAAKRHTYGETGKTFTITGLKNGVSLQKLTPPIFDVTKVVVFLTKCYEPLMVYLESGNGNEKTHKWYRNTDKKNKNSWTVENKLGSKDLKKASSDGNLVTTLEEIKGNLGLQCPEEEEEKKKRQAKEEKIRLEKEQKFQKEVQKEQEKAQLQQPPAPVRPSSTANKCSKVDAIVDPVEKLFDEVTGTLVDLGYVAATEVGLSVTEELLKWNSELGLDVSTLALNLAEEALGLANTVFVSRARGDSDGKQTSQVPLKTDHSDSTNTSHQTQKPDVTSPVTLQHNGDQSIPVTATIQGDAGHSGGDGRSVSDAHGEASLTGNRARISQFKTIDNNTAIHFILPDGTSQYALPSSGLSGEEDSSSQIVSDGYVAGNARNSDSEEGKLVESNPHEPGEDNAGQASLAPGPEHHGSPSSKIQKPYVNSFPENSQPGTAASEAGEHDAHLIGEAKVDALGAPGPQEPTVFIPTTDLHSAQAEAQTLSSSVPDPYNPVSSSAAKNSSDIDSTPDKETHVAGSQKVVSESNAGATVHETTTTLTSESHAATSSETTGSPAPQHAAITSVSVPGTPGLPGPTGEAGSDSNDPFWIKAGSGISSGILGTSALACFAGWKLYNRYKGDPWVRQI